MDFTEENIAALFGHEAAEDEDIERLKSYYFVDPEQLDSCSKRQQ